MIVKIGLRWAICIDINIAVLADALALDGLPGFPTFDAYLRGTELLNFLNL